MLKNKSLKEINANTEDVIHRFALSSKVKFLGSASKKGISYYSDYDLFSPIKESADALAKHFQQIFSKPFKYFMETKIGEYKGKKLIWTQSQIKKGINKGIKLADAIKQDALIKTDIILEQGNSFVEISIIYNTKYQTQKTKEQIESEFEDEIKEYSKDNSFKALKRLYSLLSLDDKNIKLKEKLIKFFNSDIGLVNKVANDLATLSQLVSKYKINYKKIFDNVQMLKEKLSVIPWISVKKFDEITSKNYKSKIKEIIEYIRDKVNLPSKIFLNEFKNII
jgi:hypothetical protein